MNGAAASPFVRVGHEDGIVTLTLSRPETLNRLTTGDQFLELAQRIREVQADPTARVLVITGEGRAFCAGGDIRKMAAREGFSAGSVSEIQQRYRQTIHQVPLALTEADIPTIAAVNGAAYGAGCDLACFCDLRVAARSATFAVSFAQLGIVSGDGGSWILPRLVGRSKAMELTFTADPIDAEAALRIGLVSSVVDDDALLAHAHGLARRIARHPSDAMQMSKRLLKSSEQMNLAGHLDLVAAFQAIAHASPEHLAAVEAAVAGLKARNQNPPR